MPGKQQLLDQIGADIIANNICPDLAKQATQLVLGTGDPNADVVFIGEAPGKKEDATGEPFVGASGRFLNEMLDSIGLTREQIYITNIVKYRPPENRDPSKQEKQAFLPYLQRQLEVIAPKVVVTLGRHSANCFLPRIPSCASCLAGGLPEQCLELARSEHRKVGVAKATAAAKRKNTQGQIRSGRPSGLQDVRACDVPLQISKSHGIPVRTQLSFMRPGELGEDEVQGVAEKPDSVSDPVRKQDGMTIVILPLYHPAAALYNGKMRQTLLDDFAIIPTLI